MRRRANELGDAEFVSAEGESISFRGLDEASDRVATALGRLGVQPGDRVLALALNSVAFLVAMLATHKRRAIFTPINTELKGSFLEHQVRNSDPRWCWWTPSCSMRSRWWTRTASVPSTRSSSAATVTCPSAPGRRPWRRRAGHGWDELAATAVDLLALLRAEPSDVCTIMYTSGTTARPRACCCCPRPTWCCSPRARRRPPPSRRPTGTTCACRSSTPTRCSCRSTPACGRGVRPRW
ncbi:MAG: class I adenylate-forming enzyme family protein [Acidimicrobiales bacterium]